MGQEGKKAQKEDVWIDFNCWGASSEGDANVCGRRGKYCLHELPCVLMETAT